MLTQMRLKELLHYDPSTGVFTWLRDRRGTAYAGSQAGSLDVSGYRVISVDSRPYRASHLAWLYMTGEMPSRIIDHADLARSNDRWDNLRLADRSQNAANTAAYKNSQSGVRGVYWNKQQRKWCAQLRQGGKLRHISFHTSIDDAAKAYARAAADYFKEFARTSSVTA